MCQITPATFRNYLLDLNHVFYRIEGAIYINDKILSTFCEIFLFRWKDIFQDRVCLRGPSGPPTR
jgi:hypothetical protein